MKYEETVKDLLVKKNSWIHVKVILDDITLVDTKVSDHEFDNMYEIDIKKMQVKKNGNE